MKKKGLLTLCIAASMSLSFSLLSFAGEWKKDDIGGWQTSTGSYPTNSWCWIDGNQDGIQERYYFNESGYLLVNTTTPDNNIVDANGACVVDGAVCQAKTGSTYFRSETWRDNGPESEVGFDEFCNEYYKLIQETLGMSLEEYLNNT